MVAQKQVSVQDNNSGQFFPCGLRTRRLLLAILACVAIAGALPDAHALASDTFEKKRYQMVEKQIKNRSIDNLKMIQLQG